MKIRPALLSDAGELSAFAIQMFMDKFGHMYSQADSDDHIEKTLSRAYFETEIPKNKILVVENAVRIVAYCKWGALEMPVETPPTPNVEIHRLYVHHSMRGQGIGHQLMQAMFAKPIFSQARAIYLSVFSENLAAQRFYQRYGFSKQGEYEYRVGNHIDHEFIYGLIPNH